MEPDAPKFSELQALPGFATATFVGAPLDCTTQLVKAMIEQGYFQPGSADAAETIGKAFETIYKSVDSCIPPLDFHEESR